MTDDTRCPGCNLPIDSGTHTFGCPHLGSDSIPVMHPASAMISPGWALTREANRLERDLKMGKYADEHWDECYLVHPVCAAELRVVKYGFIVADLIADLRAHHQGEPASGLLNGDGKIRCQTCVYQVCPCATAMHLDRAEARLKGLTDE